MGPVASAELFLRAQGGSTDLDIKPATHPHHLHRNESFVSDLRSYLPRKRRSLGRNYYQGSVPLTGDRCRTRPHGPISASGKPLAFIIAAHDKLIVSPRVSAQQKQMSWPSNSLIEFYSKSSLIFLATELADNIECQ